MCQKGRVQDKDTHLVIINTETVFKDTRFILKMYLKEET